MILPLILYLAFSGGTQPAYSDYSVLNEVGGRLWFPTNLQARSTGTPIAILAHGNGFNFESYQYLVQTLNQEGIAVACIQMKDDEEIQPRAQHIVNHFNHLQQAYPGTFSDLILIGHSRGGEAVAHAANILAEKGRPVQAVIAMAPSYLEPLVAINKQITRSLMVLYGSHDTDISGYYDPQYPMSSPFALYDNAFEGSEQFGCRKMMLFIHGASHTGFSDLDEIDEHPDGGEKGYLSPQQQRLLTKEYVRHFLRWNLFGNRQSSYLLTQWQGSQGLMGTPKGPPEFSSLIKTDYVVLIDDFEDENPLKNACGGLIYNAENSLIELDEHVKLDAFSPHFGKGMKIVWKSNGSEPIPPKVIFELNGLSLYDIPASHLAFNVSQCYLDPFNLEKEIQRLSLSIRSASGITLLDGMALEPIIYPVINRASDPSGSDFTKTAMQTVLVPLEAFNNVDWSSLLSLEFIFNIPRQDGQYTGCLILDDIGIVDM